MRSIPPYSHHPREPRVSAAPTVSAQHSEEGSTQAHVIPSQPCSTASPEVVELYGPRVMHLGAAYLILAAIGVITWWLW